MRGLAHLRRAALALASIGLLAACPSAASAGTFAFSPTADTYVNSAYPTTAYGRSSALWVDATPVKEAYMRFRVSGLDGRRVLGAQLRMVQADASSIGGRVFSIAPATWSEATTYQTRPAIDGPLLGGFGAVKNGATYEVDVSAAVGGEGVHAFALDSPSSDAARWGSRESANPPQLVVEVEDTGTPIDGLSQVVEPEAGSSSPTYFGTNHRMAMTSGGRLLTVHGRHTSGVQLRWRDPESGWLFNSLGSSISGMLLAGTGTGDWPASIAVTRDSAGAEHAWAVWSRTSYSSLRQVQMARLSNLDAPGGPTIGPATTVDAPAGGAYRADIGFERAPDGSSRGTLLWSRRVGDSTYEVATAWFTDLDTPSPPITDPTVLLSSSSYSRYGSLEPSTHGMRAAVKDGAGRLRVYAHDPGAPLSSWTTGTTTVSVAGHPAATGLDSGDLLVGFETSISNTEVRVQRFSAAATPAPTELRLVGYRQPTVASDGTRAWLVMVRASDGLVVSREYDPATGWSASDRVEIGAEGGGNHAYPNAMRRTDGRLRFVVRGPNGSSTSKSSVLAFQRGL